MTLVVLDASVAVAWSFPSQATEAADRFAAEQVASAELMAPDVFQLAQFGELAIELVRDDGFRLTRAIALAREEQLSLFDAFYLDLAIRRQARIASKNGPLLDAGRRRGVAVKDLR